MENQNDRSVERREIVTLILKTKLFEVDKQKLINKSRYFAALLSANYMDFHQSEHIINYEIPFILFEDFIHWIHYDNLIFFTINIENLFEHGEHLLSLLELSVLFAVDDLIDHITHELEAYYLWPKHAIDIWLVAQELSLNLLRDVSLSICLDCFVELPHKSLYKLSKQNFLKLVGNINVRSTESYLIHIVHEWMKLHQDTIPLDIVKNKQPRILHSIISCENDENFINSKFYLHCWDGNNFFELTTFEYPKEFLDLYQSYYTNNGDSKSILSGMQITIKGYNLYLSGGEFGIGSGKFNTRIYRYSLISKRWFFQTTMPCPRRHMIAVILKNKLLLVGGVGKYRLKLNSLDIYNVHTGIWSKGATIPKEIPFTSVPEHFVFNEKLIIYNLATFFCVYCPNKNIWTYIDTSPINQLTTMNSDLLLKTKTTPILMLKIAPCYIDTSKSDEIILRSITKVCDVACHKICNESKKFVLTDLLWKSLNFEKITAELFDVGLAFQIYESGQKDIIVVAWDTCGKFDNVYLHSVPIRNQKFRSLVISEPYKKFFNIIDPADLHIQSMNYIL